MENKQYLYIEGDTNDGDYISSLTLIDENVDLDVVRKVCKVLKETKYNHNWPQSEYCDESFEDHYIEKDLLNEEDIEIMDEWIPYGEESIHSIKSIKIVSLIEKLY